MFIWILLIGILLFGWINPKGFIKTTHKSNDPSVRQVYMTFATLGILVWFIASIINTGVVYHHDTNVQNSQYVVEARIEQRNELLTAFDEVLNQDEFIQLMEASVPEDILFLKTNPQVSGFLLGRADRIVSINRELYIVQNQLLDISRGVCNSSQNPLVPKIPFIHPDCRLGELQEIFVTAP